MKEGDARLKCIAGAHAVLVAENWVWEQCPAPRKKKDMQYIQFGNVYVCNPSIWETEARLLGIQGILSCLKT